MTGEAEGRDDGGASREPPVHWYARNIALPLVLFFRDNWFWLLALILPGHQMPSFSGENGDSRHFEDELARQRHIRRQIL